MQLAARFEFPRNLVAVVMQDFSTFEVVIVLRVSPLLLAEKLSLALATQPKTIAVVVVALYQA